MSQTLPPPLFDPFAPGFTDDPYPQYAAVRAGAPVHRHPLGFWLLTRYEDVSWLLRAGLSVEDGNIGDRQLLACASRCSARRRPAPAACPCSTATRRTTPGCAAWCRRRSRRGQSRRCGRASPDWWTDARRGESQGRVDLVDALAFPLPFAVIAEMLGTPPADHERIRQLSGTVVRSLEPVNDPAMARAIVGRRRRADPDRAEMIAWKRAHPADDLLTALINAEDDGDVLGRRRTDRADAAAVHRRARDHGQPHRAAARSRCCATRPSSRGCARIPR